ncbi:MAG: helix-turn-helix domain-containing protein, partial [Gaiellaceae bacterium]
MFEIGNSLREARLRQALEFPQIEQATKIRSKYLRALEEEQFEVLPAQTYVKGFLRSYAEYLGLDGQLYVDEYNSRFFVGDEEESPLRRRRQHNRQ